MKDEKEKKSAPKKGQNKYARFYAVIGIASLVLAVSIVATATALGNRNSTTVGGIPEIDQPVQEEVDDTMTMPVLQVSLSTEHGFFYSQTLGYYGHHDGVDFKAEAGTDVFCVKDGVVESVYKGDKLSGTEIIVDHGDGLKTLYRFVEEVEGLKKGVKVQKGQKIATVAEANGGEYKEGAHLHFEVLKDGKSIDPAGYLPLGDK
ncbi:MAG: M23 family metallopeptidase [Clostridia bacterium]|nr:M23 family metallopeptidase [Clostridia bacterium]